MFNEDGIEVINEDEVFINIGCICDVVINLYMGFVYVVINGLFYFGSGFNCIIEYCNEVYEFNSVVIFNSFDQFIKVIFNLVGSILSFQLLDNFIGSLLEIVSFNGQVVL